MSRRGDPGPGPGSTSGSLLDRPSPAWCTTTTAADSMSGSASSLPLSSRATSQAAPTLIPAGTSSSTSSSYRCPAAKARRKATEQCTWWPAATPASASRTDAGAARPTILPTWCAEMRAQLATM
jgi:hypothetical protein